MLAFCMRLLPFVLLALVIACSDDDAVSDAGILDGGSRDSSAPDAADAMTGGRCAIGASVFDESLLHTLDLQLSSADWAAMIQEAEDSPEYGGPDKTYFNAQMTFDGVPATSPIAMRLKGHFSLISADEHSFPLKLDFNRVSEEQTLDGLTKVNLHPNQNGVSAIREYLSYGAIRNFGVPSARVGFVRVTINGEAVGLYSIVEHIKGKFVRCHYSEPFGDLYKPEEPVGNLNWLGESIADYEPLIQFKWPDESASEHASLLNLLDVVNRQPVSAFESVLDVEGVLTYFALNVGLGNFDYYASFGHNYYLYEASPGRFTMLPWDMNLSQAELENPCGLGRNTVEWPISNKLLGDTVHVQQYLEILDRFLRGPGSVARLNARIDSAVTVVGDLDESAVSELRAAIQGRVESQLTAIAGGVDVCPEAVTEDSCTQCLFDRCGDEFSACDEDEGCSCLADCEGDEEVCLTACELMSAPPSHAQLVSCVVEQCSEECG